MRNYILLSLFLPFIGICQNAFQNFGNIQMHDEASIGFHTNLVNDGDFDENLGFTGFYNEDETLTVSGNNEAIFNNVEIDVIENLELYTSLGVSSELLFLSGKVVTPREDLNISLNFINHDLYAGEDDMSYIDGYATTTGNSLFTFPIGDDERLRPMITPNQTETRLFQGAYFYEDPNTPDTFSDSFTTTSKHFAIENVSTYEFWDLNGNTDTQITLTWDNLSNINSIAKKLEFLVVVGWNISTSQWENLGSTNITGNSSEGTITSREFLPNQYEVITIGSLGSSDNNFLISPNNDDVNDALVFEELKDFPVSKLVIFNRWGNIVFSRENYQNDFKGISEGRATINKDNSLPVGTYFYELKYGKTDLTLSKKGWVYINR